jgi:undecaprenyl-diphosphatase
LCICLVSIKAFTLLLSLFVVILVGFSRAYLGVHWPSDVLAGWTIGAVWALLCWLVARWQIDYRSAEQH